MSSLARSLRTLRPSAMSAATAAATAAPASATAGVHSVAVAGFGEGTNDLYDRARPSYPAASLQHIRSAFPTEGATVLEPGSGTGIFSRLVLDPPAPDYPVFGLKKLVSIEPSSGMRNAWDRGMSKISAAALEKTDATTVDGGFDDFSQAGVAPGTVDAAIVAQAWHWCPDYEAALRETAKYLKPGAPLVLIWNLESDHDEWHAKLRNTFQPYDLGSPQYYRMLWRKMFDTKAYSELFEPAEDAHFPWAMGMTEDGIVDRLFSKSYLTEAHLSGERRVKFEEDIRKVIREGDKEWIDKEKGIFKFVYTTDVWILRRK